MAGSNLSPEIWKNWDKTGKSEFLKVCKQLIKDEDKSPVFAKNDKITPFTRHVYDLIVHGIKGPLRKENVVSTFAEILPLHSEIPAIVLDILSTIDAETSSDNQNEERNSFCFIVKETEKFLSDKLVKERLEIDTLQDVGILKNRNFYTKFIKVKTKLYYKQRKFNLFREESEGYAKLCVELNQDPSGSVNVNNILEVIKSLIGCFNLDPNRVLDVILESFETRPDRCSFFIPLLRSYMSDAKIICEVLGFKYAVFQSNLEGSTPHSLYILTAHLLQHNIIGLDDIYFWLVPDDKILQKDWDKEMKDAREYFRKLQIISTKEKEEPIAEEKEIVQDKYHTNQKFGLCQALLEIGDWTNAQLLIKKIPEHYAMEQPEIAKALCSLLHSILEPVYRKYCRLAPKIPGRPVPLLTNKLAPKPVETFLQMRESAIPMLVTLGPSLHYDATLMYKVIRIVKAALSQSTEQGGSNENSLYFDILSIFDAAILPSLSYMDCNCCIAEEVWNVLKLYPYQYRYCLYGRWKNYTNQQYPKLLKRRGDAQRQIKNIMKRVSKETIKPVGRHIGKLTHCSPGFLFDYVLLQIQIYDNLINPVVDSLKYLTNLSYDVLGYCLIEALAQVHKERFKDDSTSISSWLQSLASFCGAIFKKYNIELSGLLQFVANQLKAQKSLDLLILKEIVQKMAGIEAAEELTPEQVDAMSGGEILKSEAGQFSQIRNTKKSSQRLKEAMAEQNLAVTLCLLIAQQKFCVVYREADNSPLKLVGKLYDQCQDTLVQFGTFLGSTMSMDEYIKRLPSIQSMLQDYHIHTDVAFFLARPMFTHGINIKYDQLRKSDPNCKKLSTLAKQQKYYEAVTEVMAPVITSVYPLHSPKVWEDISPQFLVTFWSLTMFDLHVPVDSYQRECNKLKQASQQALDSKDLTGGKGKKEQERYIAIMEKLQDERKKQQEHVEKVLYRLKQEKDKWFLSKAAKNTKNDTITQFLQLCLFPRCIFTAIDAVYCAKFVHTIHMLKTANFSTLLCYDRLFCDITYCVTLCTENEANRYGRFLCAMLETVMRWHSKKAIFDEECSDYPGFVTKFRVSNQFSEACDHVGYENYRHVCHKWHFKITRAISTCLESKDYVQIRNSLIILIKILPHFPVLTRLYYILEKRIEKVREEEKGQRQDLYILATSYLGQLKSRSSSMMKESDFHSASDKPPKKVEDNTNNSETSDNPTKISNGDIKEKDKSSDKSKENSKEKTERRSVRRMNSPSSTMMAPLKSTDKNYTDEVHSREKTPKEKSVKDKEQEHREKQLRKEERREEMEREKEKRRERREEKLSHKEDRQHGQHRDDRYIEMVSPKDEDNPRYPSSDDQYYYMVPSNGGNLPSGPSHRRSQEMIEPDPRDVKRRKTESNSSKSLKHEDRERRGASSSQSIPISSSGDYLSTITTERNEKLEKKDRSSKAKDKRDKTDEEKELRKERKLGRKRDRAEEALLLAEQKRRKDEEKMAKISSHQNGDMVESPHIRDKHNRSRSQEKSPYGRERDRSHDRIDSTRDKHRRNPDGKRR